MKTKIAGLGLGLVMGIAAMAQDAVYLKDGSIIKGKIVEQTWGGTVKLERGNGSVMAFDGATVEKVEFGKAVETSVVQEQTAEPETQPTETVRQEEPAAMRERKSRAASDYELKRGFRGWVDVSGTFGVSATRMSSGWDYYSWLWGNEDECYDGNHRVEVNAVFGYQIMPQLFVGGGVGIHGYVNMSSTGMDGWVDVPVTFPLFVDLRSDFLKKKITPYAEVRGGYAVGGFNGAYVSPTVGVRFGLGSGKLGMSVGLGYSWQWVRSVAVTDSYYDIYGTYHEVDDFHYESMNGLAMDGLSVRVGVEF